MRRQPWRVFGAVSEFRCSCSGSSVQLAPASTRSMAVLAGAHEETTQFQEWGSFFFTEASINNKSIINPKNYYISSKVITITPLSFSIKFYSVAAIHILFLSFSFTILVKPNKKKFNVKFLSRFFGQLSKL